MRKSTTAAGALLLLAVLATLRADGEGAWEYAVQVSAHVQVTPPRIRLSWLQDGATSPTSYRVYRKAPVDTSWGPGVALCGSATNYVDDHVEVGTAYEYQIIKNTPLYTGYGYIYSGIEVPITDNRGKLLLVVDDTYTADLAGELALLQQDLMGDGWTAGPSCGWTWAAVIRC